ncbi:NADH-cytochrome b5 reductase-like isoform X3 [Apostichopus japonicus]|uniref:NADH-cytochrome b5 reductase-like isoform X3 n=1 Tax=Stichopus japonicus TaxID=307972 RepID=UPI003AB290B4
MSIRMDDFDVCDACLVHKPLEPGATDCCGQGCQPCVLDIHQDELNLWKLNCWKTHGEGSKEEQIVCKSMKSMDYTSCVLDSIQAVSTDTFKYTFKLPEGCSLQISIGMHLILRQTSSHGGLVSRQYTPISPPGNRKEFTILIKLYQDGQMSNIIRNWQVGSVTDWRGPLGSFSYHTNQYSHIYLLAAGTGITPIYQIIRHIVQNEEEETILKLLYASRTYRDILMRKELNDLAHYWNFKVLYFVSDGSEVAMENKFTRGESAWRMYRERLLHYSSLLLQWSVELETLKLT